MGGVRVGILGTDAGVRGGAGDSNDVLGGGDPPGTLGVNYADAMSAGKKRLDDETDHGSRTGVKYGDVILDLSLT